MFQVVDVESEHEEVEKEISSLRRCLADVEDDRRAKEQSFRARLEEARQTECQLSDDRCQVEQSLDEARTELIETRLQLNAAEGRASALESQLTDVDSCRVETETKLASVMSSLRRFVGLGDGPMLRSRSLSSLRSRSRSPSLSPRVKGQSFVFDC